MQTLQATAEQMTLKVIPFTRLDSPITFRIVDQDGTLIAKINGQNNVPIAAEMVRAYNSADQMKRLLKARLFQILSNVAGAGLTASSIRLGLKNGKGEDLVEALKGQMVDAPIELEAKIGREAMEILEVL